jgi:hypothetical protein
MWMRSLHAELYDFYSRPLQWMSIILVSLTILFGVDQLALDKSVVSVLIVDTGPDQSEGHHIFDLIGELSAVEPKLSDPDQTFDQAVTNSQADIVLHKVNDLWQATLRPRSILDHRRLARTAFSLAEVVNHLGPWDTVMSADSMSRRNYRNMVCDIGEHMCAILRSVGDARYKDLCLPHSASDQQADATAERTAATADEAKDGSPDESEDHNSCAEHKGPVLESALSLAKSLKSFCDPGLIDSARSKGVCTSESEPTLASVVSMVASPQSHTRVFIARTICLLSVFLAFVLCCRSWMQETRHNSWQVIGAIAHGNINHLLAAKIIVSTLFALLLASILLEFSAMQFGISIKPGLSVGLFALLLAAMSSSMLGLAVALVVRSEASAYIVASLYLLISFVLSGYIDDDYIRSGLCAATEVCRFSHRGVDDLRYAIASER